MPASASMEDGESKTLQGYINDDYTPLEDLVMSAACDNASVSIVKQSGDLFNIVVNANQGYVGDTQVEIYAQDDEGNDNTYNIPLTINEVQAYMTVNLSFEGIDVQDGNSDGVIDGYSTGQDIGEVRISAYKTPVNSIDESKNAIYVDRSDSGRIPIFENVVYDASQGANLQIPKGSIDDFLVEIEIEDTDGEFWNRSLIIDPSKDSIDNHIRLGEDEKKFNIWLAQGIGNHANSQDHAVDLGYYIPYVIAKWLHEIMNHESPDIWILRTPEDEEELTPEMEDAIYEALEECFPDSEITELDADPGVLPDNTILVENTDSPYFAVDNYDYSNITSRAIIGVDYDCSSAVAAQVVTMEETASARYNAAEIASKNGVDMTKDSIFAAGQQLGEFQPLDYAGFKITDQLLPGDSIMVDGDVYGESTISIKSNSLWVNYNGQNRLFYVLPVKKDDSYTEKFNEPKEEKEVRNYLLWEIPTE
jgi:hypothetical protein